jgi:hypothetical protein
MDDWLENVVFTLEIIAYISFIVLMFIYWVVI